MASVKSKTWPLAEATSVAEDLITLLRPACERIEVAGSVRRNRVLVGDVELLVVSKEAPNTSLWLERPPLDARILQLMAEGILNYRLNKNGSRTFGPFNKLLAHIPSGIPIDLFSTTLANWGLSLVIRTGPKEFNIKMMTRLKTLGLQGHVNQPIQDQNGDPLPCPTEEILFRLLGWRFLPPEERR